MLKSALAEETLAHNHQCNHRGFNTNINAQNRLLTNDRLCLLYPIDGERSRNTWVSTQVLPRSNNLATPVKTRGSY